MAVDITIDHNKLMQLLASPNLVQLLPPLQTLASQKAAPSSGGGCCGRKNPRYASTYNDRNTALRDLGNYLGANPTALATVKAALQATTLRIKYRKMDSSMFIVKKL